MGKRSELSVSQRVEVVLMILRKEEPISVLTRRYSVSENVAINHSQPDATHRPLETAGAASGPVRMTAPRRVRTITTTESTPTG